MQCVVLVPLDDSSMLIQKPINVIEIYNNECFSSEPNGNFYRPMPPGGSGLYGPLFHRPNDPGVRRAGHPARIYCFHTGSAVASLRFYSDGHPFGDGFRFLRRVAEASIALLPGFPRTLR